jgi:hypothetical protein
MFVKTKGCRQNRVSAWTGAILIGAVSAAAPVVSTANAALTIFTGSGTSPDGPVSAEASITTGNGTITVSLTDFTLAHSQGQALSDIFFDLSNAPGSLGSLTQSGQLVDVTAPSGAITPLVGDPDHWGLAVQGSNTVILATAGPGAPGGQPRDMIIGGTDAGGVTGGFDNFNPYILGTGTFTFSASGVTAATTASNVILSFGTEGFSEFTIPGTPIPERSTWVMMVVGFGLLGLVAYRKARTSVSIVA